MLKIQNSNLPLNTNEITKFEKSIKLHLPRDYKNFLCEYNGGQPNMRTFDFMGDSNDGSNVDSFFGINHPLEIQSIEYILRVFSHRIPKELFPIARDSYGNIICLCIQGANLGRVYFWDHENEQMDPTKGPWWENIYLVANSFTEFLGGLYKFDIDEKGNEIREYQDGKTIITSAKNV